MRHAVAKTRIFSSQIRPLGSKGLYEQEKAKEYEILHGSRGIYTLTLCKVSNAYELYKVLKWNNQCGLFGMII